MNPFDVLKPTTKNIKPVGLNEEITIRELMLEDITEISDESSEVESMYLYVSKIIVSPKMTVKELKKLGTKALPTIKDILSRGMPKSGNLPTS